MVDESFSTPAPPLSESKVLEVAGAFGLRGSIHRLGGERDQNFLVREDPAQAWVLKAPHPAEDLGAVELRLAAFAHCSRCPTIPRVPQLRPTHAGALLYEFRDDAGRVRRAYVVDYIEGRLLHQVAPTRTLRRALGRDIARLDAALSTLRHAPASRPLIWDLTQAGCVKVHLQHVRDDALRARATRALARFDADVQPRLGELRWQFVHNDVNPHNVVVTGDGTAVAGIIDFGDLVHSPLVNDLAIAVAYQVAGDDPIGSAIDVVAGYHAELPLHPDEVAVLPDLVATRMAVAVAISSWRAELNPAQRPYITRNLPAAAAGLALLESTPDFPRRLAEALT